MRGYATDIGVRAVVAIRARFRGAPKSKVGTATDASSMEVLWPIVITKHRRGKSTARRTTQRVDHERSLGQIRSVRCEGPQPAFFAHLPWESDASAVPPSWVELYRQQLSGDVGSTAGKERLSTDALVSRSRETRTSF